jgi:hypothetical protein
VTCFLKSDSPLFSSQELRYCHVNFCLLGCGAVPCRCLRAFWKNTWLPTSALKIQAIYSSEILATTYKTTRRHVSEHHDRHLHHGDSFRSLLLHSSGRYLYRRNWKMWTETSECKRMKKSCFLFLCASFCPAPRKRWHSLSSTLSPVLPGTPLLQNKAEVKFMLLRKRRSLREQRTFLSF